MELIDGLKTRRTTRAFSTRALTRETILQILDIARYAPSGANKNAWRFIVTTDKSKLTTLSQMQPFSKWLANAQAAVAIAADPAATQYWLEDCSAAAYAIYLAGLAKGVGVAWAAVQQSADPAEDMRRQTYARDILSIPKELNVPILMGLGYPQDTPLAPRKMPALEELVSWEAYGQK